MFNVLIVEDDKNIRKLMEIKLKAEGYNTTTACDGLDALDKVGKSHYDILIVDAMMPNMNGYEFLTEIKNLGINTPSIMVTAKGDIEDKSKGFTVGVDDYMVKPIDFKELSFRIKAVLRRAKIVSERKIQIGDTLLDYDTLTVSNSQNSITLTKKEFGILYKLMSFPEQSFSKRKLFEEFWDFDSETEEDTLKVHINKIRNKISVFKNIDIETVRGIGYRGVKRDNEI